MENGNQNINGGKGNVEANKSQQGPANEEQSVLPNMESALDNQASTNGIGEAQVQGEVQPDEQEDVDKQDGEEE